MSACLCGGKALPDPTPVTTLEVVGITIDGEVAYRFNRGTVPGEVMTLTADDLGELAREIRRDSLPLWPLRVCRFCDTDAVTVDVEGNERCMDHLSAFGNAENEQVDDAR